MEEKKGIIDKFLDFIFKKSNFYLILILIIALILRVIAASNIGPIADEMNVAVRSIDVHKSGTMNSIDESHSFYFLNEIVYKLTGSVSLFTARFASIFFGLLSILLIYLIVLKLYKSEKIALISCFLAAISGFQIRYSSAEMDITMAFFVLLSSYAFISAVYDKKDRMYYFSALFLGLAIAIKTFAGIWVLSYLAFALYYSYKNKDYKEKYFNKKGLKIIIFSAIIIFISVMPIITANYLLYKDKGIVDLQISRFFNINKEVYKGLGGIESPFMLSQIWTGMKAGFNAFWQYDALITILAVFGFVITFKKYKKENLFLFFWFIFVFLFISGTAWLATHFVFNTLIFSIFSALFLVKIDELAKKFNFKWFIVIGLVLIFIINLLVISPYLTSQTAVSKMREFAVNNIGKNDLVIVDQRIFRGQAAFMFNDKAYIESANFNSVMKALETVPEQEVLIKTYFIECITDDCGWGTIQNQPELNQSMEETINFFRNISQEKAVFYGGGGQSEIKGGPRFRVYETNLQLKPSILGYVKQTHYHYFYPVGWQGNIYDKYQVHNVLDSMLNKIGFFIFYITILLEVLSPLALIWFFIREKKINKESSEEFSNSLNLKQI